MAKVKVRVKGYKSKARINQRRTYQEEINSCLNEVRKYVTWHPWAKKCVIWRENNPQEFRDALRKRAAEKCLSVEFGCSGKIIFTVMTLPLFEY